MRALASIVNNISSTLPRRNACLTLHPRTLKYFFLCWTGTSMHFISYIGTQPGRDFVVQLHRIRSLLLWTYLTCQIVCGCSAYQRFTNVVRPPPYKSFSRVYLCHRTYLSMPGPAISIRTGFNILIVWKFQLTVITYCEPGFQFFTDWFGNLLSQIISAHLTPFSTHPAGNVW